MIETNLKPHDIVALVPIIEGAGGVVTTWDGERAAKGGRIIAAGDRAVYERRAACCSRDSGARPDPAEAAACNQSARDRAKKTQ